MNLNRVTTFVHVIEAGSFTKAARAIGVPKSSVSRSLARLEQDLGRRLLQRTSRRIRLTDAGKIYYDRARTALASLEEATETIADMGGEPKGTIRMTAPATFGLRVLPEAIARFVARYPEIRVELTFTSRVVDMVGEGFDLAIRAGRLADSTLVVRRVRSRPFALFAAPAYLRRRGRPRTVADLAAHECVLFVAKQGQATWRLMGPSGEEKIEVAGRVEVDDLLYAYTACVAGLGVALLPRFLARSAGRALVRLLPAHSGPPTFLQIVSPPKRYEPTRITLLRDFLATRLG